MPPIKADQQTDAPAQPINTPEHIAKANNTPAVDVAPDQDFSQRPFTTTGETVTVACKLPHGLVLQVCEQVEHYEPVMGGGMRKTTVGRWVGPRVVLNGSANPVGAAPKNLTFGGYAITYGVPRDVFERWLEQNKDSEIVTRDLVFALPNSTDTKLRAKEQNTITSGLEPIDPTKRWKVGALSTAVVEEMVR